MAELRFAYGPGRLLRTESVVAFTAEPNNELFALLQETRTVGGKELSVLLVKQDFDLPAFVILDLASSNVFVFGDLVVEAGDASLDGSAKSTVLEDQISSGSVTCGEVNEPDGSLIEGWVSAGAFAFQINDAAMRSSAADQPATNEDHAEVEPAIDADQPEARTSGLAPVDDHPEIASETVPDADPSVASVAEPKPESPIDVTPAITDDSWDPLADPDIDLASIGAPPEVEELTPPPPPPPSIPAPEAKGKDLTPPPTPQSPAPFPAPPVAPPPLAPPPLQPSGRNSDPTLPAPPAFTGSAPPPPPGHLEGSETVQHVLHFDDGQEVVIGNGVYVGRHPTKNGLPDGYQGATIRGEHVSRVHWELSLTNGVAQIRDLGSGSGTEVESQGQRIPATAQGVDIAVGATVHFADRWATYTTE